MFGAQKVLPYGAESRVTPRGCRRNRRDRREIVHKGMRVLPLSREKHMEAHTLGRDTFCDKYHIVPVSLDEELCKIWKLKG